MSPGSVEENGSSGGAKDSGGSVNDAGDGPGAALADLAPLPDLPLEPEPSAEPSAGNPRAALLNFTGLVLGGIEANFCK